jgi:hypothetical protein
MAQCVGICSCCRSAQEFAGSTINYLISNISISGAALDFTNPHDIPERFNLVFKKDGAFD